MHLMFGAYCKSLSTLTCLSKIKISLLACHDHEVQRVALLKENFEKSSDILEKYACLLSYRVLIRKKERLA